MTYVHFTGTHYRSPGYHFQEPGEYEVADDKARQLLRDFPKLFSPVAATTKQDPPQNAPQAPQQPAANPVNLSKANRAQLEALAAEIGLTVTDQMDTNKKLMEAIKEKQST